MTMTPILELLNGQKHPRQRKAEQGGGADQQEHEASHESKVGM